MLLIAKTRHEVGTETFNGHHDHVGLLQWCTVLHQSADAVIIAGKAGMVIAVLYGSLQRAVLLVSVLR